MFYLVFKVITQVRMSCGADFVQSCYRSFGRCVVQSFRICCRLCMELTEYATALTSEPNFISARQLAVPTQAPLRFSQPVNGFTDRGFSVTEPQYFSKTGVWQVHPGIDLQVAYGEVVKACGAGTVDAVWEDNQLGLCVRLNHEDGYQSLYAGLSNADYVRAGDPVAQGQTIGHAGNGVLAESDAEPHLHLEIWKDGRPVDPIAVFLGVDSGDTM